MKGFDVLRVKSAVKGHNKFDLSRSHLTTANFGEIIPLLAQECIPGDKMSVKADYFSRLAPLVKPTYGKFSFKTVSGFVPYHQIAVDADAWLAGKTTWEGQTPHHRFITVQDLDEFVRVYCATTTGATSSNADYSYITNAGVVTPMIFTKVGKYYVKVLNALGYSLPQGVNYQSGSSWMTGPRTMKLSAYPLLAFFKLYNDYMSQSQRFNTSALSDFLYKVKYNIASASLWTNTSGQILSAGINVLFSNLFLNYENDYFTSAWQNPNAALNTVENVNTVSVPVNSISSLGVVTEDSNDTQLSVGVVSSAVKIGQRAIDFLRSFDNWVRRNNYSGSRGVQQIYSRFGIKTDDYRSHYANVISTDVMPVQVGDITASAQTTTTMGGVTQDIRLGDYSGKGIVSGSKGISCELSDHGLLIILGYFTVRPMMSFGFDRMVLRSTPLDYYNPEFDGLGAEAISYAEVYSNPLADNTDTSQDNYVFGFTERYNSYRYGRDMITGEFRNYHPDGDMNCWHSGRNLNAVRKAGQMVAQSSAMNTLPQVDSEYNRIFSVTDGGVDHFYLTAQFDVSAVRPMLNLNQVVNLGEGDTAVPRNGNVIS